MGGMSQTFDEQIREKMKEQSAQSFEQALRVGELMLSIDPSLCAADCRFEEKLAEIADKLATRTK
jgi:LDH2 family malate/lactate/ureidoglycolate dehydrogenase